MMVLTKEQEDFLTSLGIDCSAKKRKENADKLCIVGMSGGVDSSVAAAITLAQGYKTIGVFMKNWEEDSPYCTAEKDFQDVVSVCESLELDYYSVNFAREYRENVFKDFLDQYEKGLTPNPDILCNSEIKFQVFYDYAKNLGADYLVTGHYAQTKMEGGHTYLSRGRDTGKDQSYFLYRVPEKVWPEVLFPLGRLWKKDVRKVAKLFNLSTSNKKDSTGICFIGERNFRDFLSEYIKKQKGFFKTLEGEVVGEHEGQCFYTLGQRKGLGLGGAGKPWYIAEKNPENGDIIVVRGDDHPALYIDDLVVADITGEKLIERNRKNLTCKVRYRQQDQPCTLSFKEDKIYVSFSVAQKGVAKGQSIVFYDGDLCLGGGVIEQVGLTHYNKRKNKEK